MRSQGPTFWLLDGRTGWRTAHVDGVSVGTESGIRLAADSDGPLSLKAAADDLGGLTLPRGVALDDGGTLYLLEKTEPRIKHFDPDKQHFVVLPAVGGHGSEARQFCDPVNIACAGRNLYVADRGNWRVQVFDLESLALRHLWGPWDWEPVDVTARARRAYILDGQRGRVYAHRAGTDNLHLLIDKPVAANRWTRIAVDRKESVYLLDPAVPRLEIYDFQGGYVGEALDASDVRDQFDPPPVRLDHQNRFCLPASLTRLCDRQAPQVPVPPENLLALCPPWSQEGLIFDREGERVTSVDPAAPLGPRAYRTEGTWISEALDSEIYHCQWHRLELDLAALPAGTQVVVSTYADEQCLLAQKVQKLGDHLWDTRYAITGQMQPSPNAASNPSPYGEHEFLVQSQKGRYLWLRLQLVGDGYATPTVRAIRAHYPRSSYLDYLPAVFAADDESRWFLERFLSIFQTEWDDLERRIEEISRYFDPQTVPAGDALKYLAGWLAQPLEGDWDWEQKRHLLTAAPQITPRRGTIDGLRACLRIYLQNISGLDPEAQRDYPQIVEGFRERQRLMLSVENLADLGHGAPLWGPGMVGRLQLDVFAREGEVRLVSTGDPERDLFHEYAHQFRVFVPAAWVRTAQQERMLCRALDAEKPAHTRYDLCLVEPRFRVGLQSTVGLDTIIGPYPVARLACSHETDVPPSRPPRHHLGYDTVLAGKPGDGTGMRLVPGTRVGMDTILT
jgi:phage tail-like protein